MAKTANMATLANWVSDETGMSMKQTREGIKKTFEGIGLLLKKNDKVSISGVGVFAKKVKPAQKGGKKAKNPFTGEEYTTKSKPAKTSVKFRAGKNFKGHFGG